MPKAANHKAKAQRTITSGPPCQQPLRQLCQNPALRQCHRQSAGSAHQAQACSASRSPSDYLRSWAAAGRNDCSVSGCARKERPRTGQADVRSFCDAEPAGTLCTCGLSVTSPSRPQPVSSPGTQWLKKTLRTSGQVGHKVKGSLRWLCCFDTCCGRMTAKRSYDLISPMVALRPAMTVLVTCHFCNKIPVKGN